VLELSVHLHATACPHLRAPGAPWPGCAKPIQPDDQSNVGTNNNMPDNGFIESFNGRLRDECLNEHLFRSYRHAREIIEEWRIDYNLNRPHTSLDGFTPNEFAIRSMKDHNVNRASL